MAACCVTLTATVCCAAGSVLRLTNCDAEKKARFLLYALQLPGATNIKRHTVGIRKKYVTLQSDDWSKHLLPVVVSGR